MQLFSVDAIAFPENLKKQPSKVAHIGPHFFFQYWPGCPNGPKTEIPYHQMPLNGVWTKYSEAFPIQKSGFGCTLPQTPP